MNFHFRLVFVAWNAAPFNKGLIVLQKFIFNQLNYFINYQHYKILQLSIHTASTCNLVIKKNKSQRHALKGKS